MKARCRLYSTSFFSSIDYEATVDGYTGHVRAHVYRNPVDRDLVKEFGAPTSAELIIYLETYPDWPKRQDIESETLGYGSQVEIPGVRLRKHGANDWLLPPYVVMLRQQAWKRGMVSYGEVRWLDGGRRRGIGSYQDVDPLDNLQRLRGAQEAIRFVTRITPKPGGSPMGPRKGQAWTRQHCLKWWSSWTEFDGKPTQKQLAIDIGLSKKNPEEAVQRWRSTGLHWPPTEEELEELLEEEED